jgi:hypothetical protein
MAPKELETSVFSDVAFDFDPETDWLDGNSPVHPFFDNSSRMQKIVCDIKVQLLESILIGCYATMNEHPKPHTQYVAALVQSLVGNPELWTAIISAQKYGAIYLVSRSEARNRFLKQIVATPTEAEMVDAYLQKDATAIRAINYGVYYFVTNRGLRVDNPPKFVPRNAISSIGDRHIAVREQDFETEMNETLGSPKPLYDLHDFAHLTAATLSPELFGNKYFTDLVKLDGSLTALIRSPGMRTAKGPKMSDGLLFSELLTEIFTEEAKHSHTYKSLTGILARRLADYLLGHCQLLHSSTNKLIQLDRAITPTQLAVLTQNKSYELTASELEQRVFTRGTVNDMDERDILATMTASQRIKFLATSKSWLYFEVRNTVKHRAQKEAYRLIANHYLQHEIEVQLSRKILDNISYKDWELGGRVNLWNLIA